MNMGPRHPSGLTPCSLYIFMVSEDSRCRSLEYLAWISLSFGCKADIALSWRLCFTVSGIMIARTTSVNMTIASPKLLKKMLYNTSRLLIIG